jgi:DNA-3-methyladenine glycosylase
MIPVHAEVAESIRNVVGSKTRLNKNFFERDTIKVAEELLGKVLVRKISPASCLNCGKKTEAIMGRIIETEAYLGVGDKACHARHGRTKRNEVMWGEAGYAYIYLCMGLHNLLNVVTAENGQPEAVLIRKIQPLSGLNPKLKSYGPGNLTKYFDIDRSLNGVDIAVSDELFIVDDGFELTKKNIITTARVGIDYAKDHKDLPLRFILKY